MALIHADFVEETTTTTGTGSLTLAGATIGNHTFSTKIGNGNTCVYGIATSDGKFESGVGTVSAGVLARTTLLSSSTDSALDLPAGTHTVYCTFAAEGGTKAYLPSGASELSELSDVATAVSSPSDGDILVYRSAGTDFVLEAKPFTDADESKLDGIEVAAKDDQTAQEIATAIDADATAEATLKSALGLGTAAYTASTAYATSAQGSTADTATQPGDLATVATTGAYADVSGTPTIGTDVQAYAAPLDNVSGTNTGDQTAQEIATAIDADATAEATLKSALSLGTAAYTASTAYATTAQGSTADSATQPGDLAAVATTGAYSDVSGTPTVGILDSNAVVIDGTGVAGTDYAKFTLNGLEGRSYSEVRSDLNVADGADATNATNVNAAGAVMESDVDAQGDIFVATADNTLTRLAVGTDGHALTADSGEASGIKWAASASGFSDPMTTRGDIIYKNAAGTTTRLAAGTNTQVLTSDGTDIAWAAAPSGTWDGDIADIDLDGGTDIGADLTDADLILVDDGAAGTNRKSAISRLWAYMASKLSIIGGTDDILLFGVACSDETTDLTPGQKVAFDLPFNCVLERIYVSVTDATSGQNLEVDVEDEGTSLLNAVFAFQTNNSETSTFASAASSYTLTKGDLLSIDVDQVGTTTTGAGLKVFFFGYRT